MPVVKIDGHASPILQQKMDKGHPVAETALIKSGDPKLPETASGFNRPRESGSGCGGEKSGVKPPLFHSRTGHGIRQAETMTHLPRKDG